ncbi:sugar kinase [Arsenicicoccus dermatophilus]|uniref:sugar kinase n=1 Tax=Arsenicicoccus dermatophilus TaxID=1076331 RepID=UPI001F4C7F41|nr:sugar kinase [Arsenicicoccus dermatophilus]MCH8611956.1 sugar kinase [Arsenicicoccus dermatophilus]
MTYDLSTIGEGQLRLTVNQGDRLVSARSLRMTAACSEANVAGLLAQLGRRTTWASKLPQGDLGERCLQEFRSVGVDLSHMVRTESGRIALYFMEPGEFPMPGKVTYDRHCTPFRECTPEDFDWDALLDTRVLFLTGITAALTEHTAEVVQHAARLAAARGVPIALDVNHRSMLWTGEQAGRVLGPIAEQTDILFCSRRDGATVFGIEGAGPDVCRALRERFGARHVVSTDAVDGVYVSSAVHGERVFEVQRVPVIDRPGAGDSFVAATLHGYLDGDVLAGVGYGQRTASYALTHHGDLTRISARELDIPVTTDIVR